VKSWTVTDTGYVRLLRDLQTGNLVDQPAITRNRYVADGTPTVLPITITSPANGATVTGATVVVSGTTVPGAQVSVSSAQPGSATNSTTVVGTSGPKPIPVSRDVVAEQYNDALYLREFGRGHPFHLAARKRAGLRACGRRRRAGAWWGVELHICVRLNQLLLCEEAAVLHDVGVVCDRLYVLQRIAGLRRVLSRGGAAYSCSATLMMSMSAIIPAARIFASASLQPRIDCNSDGLSGSFRIGWPFTFVRYCTPKNGVLVIAIPDCAYS
jgi:hypothetical protein